MKKRLSLHRETLRTLTGRQLSTIEGGAIKDPKSFNCTAYCPPNTTIVSLGCTNECPG